MSELTEQLLGKCDWCKPCPECERLQHAAAAEIRRLATELAEAREAARSMYLDGLIKDDELLARWPWLET